MNETNNNTGNPTPNQGADPNQINDQNTAQVQNQVENNSEAGKTYWEAQSTEQNSTSEQPSQGTAPQEPFYAKNQQQMAGNPYAGYQAQQPVANSSKKSHKGLVAALIVLVLVLAAAGTAFAFKDKIKNALSLTAKSPEDYYASVEQEALNSSIDKMMAGMTEYDFSKGMAYDLSVDLTYDKATVNSLLQGTAGMTIEDLESYIGIPLDNLGFDMTVALDGSELYEEIGLRLNNIDLITAEIFMNTMKQQIFMRLPELSKAYLSMDMETLDSTGVDSTAFDFEGYFEQLENLSSDKSADFLKRYIKIITDNMSDVELSKNEELEVDDITVKANLLTVTIDQDTMLDIASAVLKEAKKDDYIIDLLSIMGLTKAEYSEAIEEAEAELKRLKNEPSMDDQELIMEVYVDGAGNIIGRTISFEESGKSLGSLGYSYVGEGKNQEYEFYLEDESGTTLLSVTGNQTKKDDAYTGMATLDINASSAGLGNLSFDLEYEDARSVVKNNRPFYYGKYTLSSLAMMGMEVVLDYNVKADVQNMALSVNMGRTPIVTLDMAMEYLDNFKIPTPSSSDEVYDALTESEYYLATMDIEKFINNLSSKLGIDLQSIVDNFMPYY